MTDLSKEEYKRRFRDRIENILTEGGWDITSARDISLAEYEAIEEGWGTEDDNDPEGSADEAMSYWADDAHLDDDEEDL